MTFQRNTVSPGISRRYTLIEVLVVISILSTLMAISSNVAIKSKKSVVGQFDKIMTTSLDASLASKGKDGAADQVEETNVRRILSKAGMLSDNSSEKGKKAGTQASVKISDRKIAALRNRKRTTVPAKTAKTAVRVANTRTAVSVSKTAARSDRRQNRSVEPEEEIAVVDFPEPEGIVPGETIITISAADAPETEIFTKFLHQNGSFATMKEYQKLWTVDVEALKEDRKFKMEQGIDVTLFSQYLRKKTVFKTSPYRTYVLRKKILLASRQTFDLKASTVKYQELAEKKFNFARKGEHVRLTINGKECFSTYQGISRFGQKITVMTYRGRRTIPLDQVPVGQRWKYDEKALKAKREAFVKQALASEEQQIKKQDEYIQKTLDAEFAVLKEDPLMANIR